MKSLQPLPEKWHGIADPEMKLRQRYVDLIMSEETREVFRRRSVLDPIHPQLPRRARFHRGRDADDASDSWRRGGAAVHARITTRSMLTLYLRIAPELYLKRLLVGGFERIYELNRVFRNEGLSTRHNPEFTMLELYQAYADLSRPDDPD